MFGFSLLSGLITYLPNINPQFILVYSEMSSVHIKEKGRCDVLKRGKRLKYVEDCNFRTKIVGFFPVYFKKHPEFSMKWKVSVVKTSYQSWHEVAFRAA